MCSPVEDLLDICTSHDATGEHCDRCNRRYAAIVEYRCTNCVYVIGGVLGAIGLVPETDLQVFLLNHGVDPVAPSSTRFWRATQVYDEEVLRTDPFEARYTFTLDDDILTLTVDDDLSVVEVAKSTTSKSA